MSPSERLIDDTSNAGAFPAPSFPVYRTDGSDRRWPEIDAGLLEDKRGPAAAFPTAPPPPPRARRPEIAAGRREDKRGPVPAFPTALLPQPWRGWVAETARAAGAPADYVAQSVLATGAGPCGGGSARAPPAR